MPCIFLSFFSACILFVSIFWVQADEYTYPTMVISPGTIALIHQISPERAELCIQDLRTGLVIPALHSRFMSTHIMLLPTGDGFSFLDNGIVRIKYFHKRSPKSIEFSSPLRAISSMTWGENMHMYMSAKYLNRYELYDATINGDAQRILFDERTDFLFPQKTDNYLFFISRSVNGEYAIARTSTFNINSSLSSDLSDDIGRSRESRCEVLIDFGQQPIAFLFMESEQSGFVVAHPPFLYAGDNGDNSGILFSYYRITKNTKSCLPGWSKHKLFDFRLPLAFVNPNSQSGLFEHIMPLLPKKFGQEIFFSHAINETIALFKYSLLSGEKYQVAFSRFPGDHTFGPLKVGDTLYYGGSGDRMRQCSTWAISG